MDYDRDVIVSDENFGNLLKMYTDATSRWSALGKAGLEDADEDTFVAVERAWFKVGRMFDAYVECVGACRIADTLLERSTFKTELRMSGK